MQCVSRGDSPVDFDMQQADLRSKGLGSMGDEI